MKKALLTCCLAVFIWTCGSDKHPTAPSGPTASTRPASAADLHVNLTVNRVSSGEVSCAGGIFLAASVSNLSSASVQLQALEVLFTPTIGACREQRAEIDPTLSLQLAEGVTADVRRFDAAGQLCHAPRGGAECGWIATARLTTATGIVAEDQVAFTTHRAPADCSHAGPNVSISEGATLSGVVDVWGQVVEDGGCAISARCIVEVYSDQGERVFESPPLDLGDKGHWNTTRGPNGRYWVTAYQNCCHIRSVPVAVNVKN